MNPTIKVRIESIRRGEVPEGYKRTKIGIVPNEWGNVLFSTLFESFSVYTEDLEKYPLYSLTIEEGITPKTERYERSFLVKKKNAYKVMRPNDFAYNPMNLRFGAVARYKGEKLISVSGYYDIFTTKSKLDLEFMDNFLIFDNMITYYNKVSIGSLIEKQRVHFSNFLNFELPLPPLTERNRIAEILAGQDRVIALKEKLLAEKQKQKKYLMQQLLTGKKRLPGFSGKRKNIRLFDLCQVIADGDWIESKDQSDMGVRLIQTGNIGIGQFLNKFNRARYISEETFTRLSCCEVFPGDVLLSRLPDPIGRACKIPKLNCRMITAVDCTILRFKKDVFADLFVYFSCLDTWQNKMVLLSGGSTRKRITRKEIENAVITLPVDEGEQTAIAEILSTADKEIELLKKDIEQEKLKKKSLMQLLLTGIVRVDELTA